MKALPPLRPSEIRIGYGMRSAGVEWWSWVAVGVVIAALVLLIVFSSNESRQ